MIIFMNFLVFFLFFDPDTGPMLGMTGGDGGNLSAYELKRLENIRQNQKILESLQIPSLAPVIEQQSTNTAKDHVVRKSKPTLRKSSRQAPKPTRVSARIRTKIEEEKTGVRRERELLRELLEPVAKAPRPRPLPGSRMPFAPEEGATEGFLTLMRTGDKDVTVNQASWSPAALSKTPKMGIKKQECVVKVLQDRIYSVALHPSHERIIAATGSKSGQLAFWDATALYHESEDKAASPYYLFHPHSGSLSTLRYNPANWSQLLSSGYEGSIMCMDIVKGDFETVYSAPSDLDEQYISTFDWFLPDAGNVLAFSDMSGFVSIQDRRQAQKAVKRFHLHTKKIGGLSVSPVNANLLATCSLDNVVCVWDRRQMKAEGSLPLAKFDYPRAVTAVNFHPAIEDCLVSTCYNDTVNLQHRVLSDKPAITSVRHNNQTGRWITTFKAFWDPKSTAEHGHVIVGDMNRGVDLIDGVTGVTHNFTSEFLTAQPAVNAAHPTLDLIVSGNASGKLALWTPY